MKLKSRKQGEVELISLKESTKLKSESDFLDNIFLAALSCFMSCKVAEVTRIYIFLF